MTPTNDMLNQIDPLDPADIDWSAEPDGPVVLTLTSCRRCGAGADSPEEARRAEYIMERLPGAQFRIANADVEGCAACADLSDRDLLVPEETEHMHAHLMGLPFQWRDPEEMEQHERLVARWTELGIWKSPEERRAARQAQRAAAPRARATALAATGPDDDLPF